MGTGSEWTSTQQKAIAIIPKFSAGMSMIGSAYILYEILVIHRRKLGRVYHRLLLAMSLYDIIESSFHLVSSWPIPEGTEGIAFANGTTLTCNIQGFFLQFGLAIPILNMCLSIYYLLVIKYSWSEEKIKGKVEPWFHGAALVVALGFSTASIRMGLFNNANLWCWIAPLPPDCLDSFRIGDEGTGNCIRGDNAWIYRWAFYYAELWFCILFVMFAMLVIYFEVRRQEKTTYKHNFQGSNQRIALMGKKKPSKSRLVATQALWYVGAFYLSFTFATINRILQQITGKTYFAMSVLHTIFEPSQGFFNFCVYIRPRYIKYKEKHPSASSFRAFKQVNFPDIKDTKAKTQQVDEEDDELVARTELKQWRVKSYSSSKSASGVLRFLEDQSECLEAKQSSEFVILDSRGESEAGSRQAMSIQNGHAAGSDVEKGEEDKDNKDHLGVYRADAELVDNKQWGLKDFDASLEFEPEIIESSGSRFPSSRSEPRQPQTFSVLNDQDASKSMAIGKDKQNEQECRVDQEDEELTRAELQQWGSKVRPREDFKSGYFEGEQREDPGFVDDKEQSDAGRRQTAILIHNNQDACSEFEKENKRVDKKATVSLIARSA